MHLNKAEKDRIKGEVLKGLSFDESIRKIIVFGSFVKSNEPRDLELAIISVSDKNYLSLALEYRRKLRGVAKETPIDLIPIRIPYEEIAFMKENNSGEVIYEKSEVIGK